MAASSRILPAYIALPVAVLLAIAGPARAETPENVFAAAISLKRAHVLRSWDQCKAIDGTDASCKKMLRALQGLETKALARIEPAISDQAVNGAQLEAEFYACYSPRNNYGHLIECWQRLADRLDAARRGEFLLKQGG